jgi:hypothetical protein
MVATSRFRVVLEWRRCMGVVCGCTPRCTCGRWWSKDAVGNLYVFEAIPNVRRGAPLVCVVV